MQKGDTEGELAFTKRLLTGFCSGLVLSSFAKVIGVVRDYLLLFLLGAGMQTDALFAAGAGSAVVWYGLTVGIGTSVLPAYVTILRKSQENASRLVSALFVWTIISGGVFAGLIFISSHELVDVLIPGASIATRQEATRLLKLMSLSFPLTGVAAIQSALLQAHSYKKLVLLMPVVNGLCGLIGTFLAYTTNDIAWVVYGGVAGWLLQCLIQSFVLRPHWRFTQTNGVILDLMNLMKTSLFITGTVYLNTAAIAGSNFWISGTSDGNITLYSLACRITLACAGLASSVLTVYFYPELIRLYDQGRHSQMKKLIALSLFVAETTAGGMLVVILSIGLGLSGLSSFSAVKGLISPVLVYTIGFLGLNMLSIIMLEFWSRICVVTGHTKKNFLLIFVSTIFSFILGGVMLPSYDIYGVAVATSVTSFMTVLTACCVLAPRWKIAFPKSVIRLPLLIALWISLAILLSMLVVNGTGVTGLYVNTCVCVLTASLVFYSFAFFAMKPRFQQKLL